jgi:hypothetical protein
MNSTSLNLRILVSVYSIGVSLKKEIFKSKTMANMIGISVGVAIAAYGEAKFDSWGVLLQLGAVAFEATWLVLIQILGNHFESHYLIVLCCHLLPCVLDYPLVVC